MPTTLKQTIGNTSRALGSLSANGHDTFRLAKNSNHLITEEECRLIAKGIIQKKNNSLNGLLGKAVSDVQKIGNSPAVFQNSPYFQNFEGGCILVRDLDERYVYEIHGDIYKKWNELGRENYGLPMTDERTTPDLIGRYNHFTNGGSIYWHPATKAHAIYGAIRTFWAENGWETSGFGYPVSDEILAPDGIGRINYFQQQAIYWSSATGALKVDDVKTFEGMIVFSDGTALGGNTTLVVNKHGDCTFSGHLHDSGFDPYSFTVLGVIMTPSGEGYTVVYSGHTEGTSSDFFGSPNRNDDWIISVNNPAIRDHWVQVNMAICEFTTKAQDNFASNVQDTLGDMAKEAAKTLAAAGVKALIALI